MKHEVWIGLVQIVQAWSSDFSAQNSWFNSVSFPGHTEALLGSLRLFHLTLFSHGCIPSLMSELSLMPVQPHGTACMSQSAEHYPRRPSNDNSEHFSSVMLLTLFHELPRLFL